MKNVSSAFREELKKDNRNYIKSADITLKNGTVLEIDNSNLWQNGMKLDTATSSPNSFDLGAIITGQLTLTLNNIDEKFSDYDFTDCTATNVKVGLKLPDGTTESLSYGKFYLNEAKYNGSIITLTFYDSIYKFDQPYSKSSLSYPATLRQIVQDACSVCGVTLGTVTFDQDDFVVQERPDDSSITFRQVLQWVGQIACYYFYADSQGRLSMKWYDLSAFEDADNIFLEDSDGNFVLDAQEDKIFTFVENGTIYPGTTMPHHNLASFVSLNTGLDDVVITGIKVIQEVDGESGGKEEISYQSGNDGYVLAVSKNKLIQGDSGNTIASLLGTKIIGMRFRTFSASGLSDPTIEAGDPVVLIDRKGNSYQSYITNNVFQPGAYQSTSLGAETPARKSATRYSQMSQVYVDYRKEIEKERTDREKALEELGNRINSSSGVFTTIEKQEDGSNIYYLHNKPQLSESDIVWKMTAEAWGVSTDGGKTYNAGMTVDGDTIVRILTATGVNADWINAGAIKVTDNEGNTIFLVDMDTKQILISGDSVQIGGKSATEAINEALEAAQNAGGINLQLDNDFQGISTDYEGNISGSFPECKTTAQVFYGQTDITNNCVFTTTKSASITGSWNNQTKTYTVTGLSADSGWVDITATYLTTISVTKRFGIEKIKGGVPGQDGAQGIPGDPGEDGKTSYFHIKYSAVSNPTSSSQMVETPNAYIGTYVDFTPTDSNDPSDYTWAKFMGDNGADGIPGTNGENGQTSYLHIAYANNSTGTLDFSTTNSTNKTYIGQYVDFIESDSDSPSKYNWTKIKGDDGQDGQDGQPGRTYFIEPSATVLKRSQNNTISPNFIEFKAFYRDGNSTERTAYAGRFKIEETTDGNTWKTLYTSSSNETSVRHELYSAVATAADQVIVNANNDYIGVPRDVVQVRCTLYEAGGMTNTMDIQSVAVVTDVDALTPLEVLKLVTQGMEGIYSPDGIHYYINASAIMAGILQSVEIISRNGNEWLRMLDSILTSGNGTDYNDIDGLLDLSANYGDGTYKVVLEARTSDLILKAHDLLKFEGADGGGLIPFGNVKKIKCVPNDGRYGYLEVTLKNGQTVIVGDDVIIGIDSLSRSSNDSIQTTIQNQNAEIESLKKEINEIKQIIAKGENL